METHTYTQKKKKNDIYNDKIIYNNEYTNIYNNEYAKPHDIYNDISAQKSVCENLNTNVKQIFNDTQNMYTDTETQKINTHILNKLDENNQLINKVMHMIEALNRRVDGHITYMEKYIESQNNVMNKTHMPDSHIHPHTNTHTHTSTDRNTHTYNNASVRGNLVLPPESSQRRNQEDSPISAASPHFPKVSAPTMSAQRAAEARARENADMERRRQIQIEEERRKKQLEAMKRAEEEERKEAERKRKVALDANRKNLMSSLITTSGGKNGLFGDDGAQTKKGGGGLFDD